jgi:exodeoxyribonuclease VII large subunit
VSAIGHETDSPLLDLVADLAASTPTDAAKRIVPDLVAEVAQLNELRDRIRQAIRRIVAAETALIDGVPQRLRAVIQTRIERETARIAELVDRARRRLSGLLQSATVELDHVRARVRGLSPQATLERGYAVVTRVSDDAVVREPVEAVGELRVRVARGEFRTAVQPVGSDVQ